MGLSTGHVYTVLDVRTNIAGSGVDLLRIRDPHGWQLKMKFKGLWRDTSPLWSDNPHIAAELNRQGCGAADDDESWCSFWMTYEEACDYFGSFEIAPINMAVQDISWFDQYRAKAAAMKAAEPAQVCVWVGGWVGDEANHRETVNAQAFLHSR